METFLAITYNTRYHLWYLPPPMILATTYDNEHLKTTNSASLQKLQLHQQNATTDFRILRLQGNIKYPSHPSF